MFWENKEYEDFVDKFKPKKTTDDCYTPSPIYSAVEEWVSKEYGIDARRFVRPFYPGGDYERFEYKLGFVVVDNPPFSIETQILRFYTRENIPFFLFAPTLTLFSSGITDITYIPCGVGITYENGAVVNTSFVTNLDTSLIRSAPGLYSAVEKANAENTNARKAELPKYTYPDEVVSSAMIAKYSKRGVDFSIKKGDAVFIRSLDAQDKEGKTIFGSGFLVAEKAAAEKAAAEKVVVWPLSERERFIVASLSKRNNHEGKTTIFDKQEERFAQHTAQTSLFV